MNYDVTVIGEIYLDHVFSGFLKWPQPGEEIFTEEYTAELGGGAVTTACALAKLGRNVQLIGMVGREQFETVKTRLNDFGVSESHLIFGSRSSGVTVSISTPQDRTFFTYRGANSQLSEYIAHHPETLRRAALARHIHIAFPLTAQDATVVLPILRANGARITLDVGHQVEWLKDPRSLEVIRAIDYLMPNEKEAALFAGAGKDYLEYCRQIGLRNGLVKLGAAGAALFIGDAEYRASAPNIDVQDTTGAGDAFDAGFIEGILSDLPPRQALEYGCICGALSTRARGALGALPTLQEIKAICEDSNAA